MVDEHLAGPLDVAYLNKVSLQGNNVLRRALTIERKLWMVELQLGDGGPYERAQGLMPPLTHLQGSEEGWSIETASECLKDLDGHTVQDRFLLRL